MQQAALHNELTSQSSLKLVLALFTLLQLADLVLTAIGVAQFGTGAEANLLLKALMETVGVLPSLVSAKLFAVGAGYFMFLLADELAFARYALVSSTVGLAICAVIPWMVILLA